MHVQYGINSLGLETRVYTSVVLKTPHVCTIDTLHTFLHLCPIFVCFNFWDTWVHMYIFFFLVAFSFGHKGGLFTC